MKKTILSIFLAISFLSILVAQTPKREMRASWLATVWGLDWPSVTVPANGTTAQRLAAVNQQKNDLINILNKMQEANMNAVFFQIRSMSDVMYPSVYENWSSFVSSERGADPGYDPLAFAIDEAHKRGMELHAWLNPYRYSTSEATHGNLPNDYAQSHPDWLLTYDSYTKILNPGKPEVVQRIVDIVEEVVTKYDVDGIVFDDYFYQNGATSDVMDQTEFDKYNPKGLARGDWRRENCNTMIRSVHNKIKQIKPYVTFGVSPAGVAASSAAVARKYDVPPAPAGSDWQYNGIYSDPLAWISEGSLDYISPQLYWTTGSANPYDKLAPWWSMVANKFGVHFYSSHSLSAMTGSQPAPQKVGQLKLDNQEINLNAISGIERGAIEQRSGSAQNDIQRAPTATNYYFQELGVQVDWNRNSDLNGAPGSVFYATAKTVGTSFVNYLKSEVFTKPALTPVRGWHKNSTQNQVESLSLSGNLLTWTHDMSGLRYVIYAIPNANVSDADALVSSKYIVGVSYTKQYQLPASINSSTHKIAVSVLDRYGNEYSSHIYGESSAPLNAAQLNFPANNANIIIPATFTWNAVSGASVYFWEVGLDAQFNNKICSRETSSNQFFSGLQPNLKENIDYYWRVRTQKPNAPDSYSEVRKFKGVKFNILSPSNGATDVSLTPQFTWMNAGVNSNSILQISTNALFPTNEIVFENSTNATSLQVPANVLMSETVYYARVLIVGGDIQASSEVVSFKTLDMPIPVPIITSPENGATVNGSIIKVNWKEQNSKGFKVEISQNATFPPRSTKVKAVDAFVYTTEFDNLTDGTYYIQVKANNNVGTTSPSTPISVIVDSSTSLGHVDGVNSSRVYFDNNNQCHLLLASAVGQRLVISLHTADGVLIRQTTQAIEPGMNELVIQTGELTKGIYLIKLSSGVLNKTLKVIIPN